MIFNGLRGALALALIGCTGHEGYEPAPSRVRTTPKNPNPNHFDQLPLDESIIGKEFTITVEIEGTQQDVRVKLNSLFEWEVGAADFSLTRLSAQGQCITPGEQIAGVNGTMSDIVEKVVVAGDHTGVDIHTELGVAHISTAEVNRVISTLHQLEPGYRGMSVSDVAMEAHLNEKGEMLLSMGNGLNGLGNLVGMGSGKTIEVPKRVGLSFQKLNDSTVIASAPPPPPTTVDHAPETNDVRWISQIIQKLRTQ